MPRRSAVYAGYVLGVFALANFFHYGNRNVLFPMYDDLRAVFAFSNAELGLLGTAFMRPHELVTLPAGWAGDRFDRRRVLALGLAVWSVAAVGTVAASSFGAMVASRAMVGVGTAVCVPIGNALLCELFAPGDKARVVSVFNLGLFLGGAAAFGIGAIVGYPLGILILAVPGLALAVMVLRLDVPPRRLGTAEIAAASWRDLTRQAVGLWRIRTLRWITVGAVVMAFASGGFSGWVYEFVAVDKGMGEAAALRVMAVALVGGVAGIMTGGVVADLLCRRIPWGRLAAISLGMLGAAPFVAILLYASPGPLFYAASFLSMFFMMWYHGPIAASIDDVAPDESAASAQALVIFTMHFFGTAPSFAVIGLLADAHGLTAALVVPTVLLVVSAAAIAGGYPSMARDTAAAHGPASGGARAAL